MTATPDHRLDAADGNVHSAWDNSLSPRLRIEPGDVVRFECRDALDGQITPGATPADVREVDTTPVHPLTGPVAVEGAEPGDALAVDLLELDHEGWGYTAVFPGELDRGLLPEAFPDPWVHVWELDDGVAEFVDGIEVPIDPFPGNIGVAPEEDGAHSTVPPRETGGNLDVKHLTAGSTLYLPVREPGALFSIGDCHAAQGDGEVCINGIEAPMTVTARLSVRPDLDLSGPRFETTGPFTPSGTDEPMVATTGVGDDLMSATKDAIRATIDRLERERGLGREEAYVLCSAAADLKINQVVNAPTWTVSAYLPESIFP